MFKINMTNIITAAKSIMSITNYALRSERGKRNKIAKELSDIFTQYRIDDWYVTSILQKHKICSGQEAVAEYLATRAPYYSTSTKYLKEMRSFAQTLLTEFECGNGVLITKKKIREIMNFLDTTYHFSNIVFGKKTVFIILNASHQLLDGLNSIHINSNGNAQIYISFFHLKGIEDGNTLEFVLFHELAHSVCANIIEKLGTNHLPAEMIHYLSKFFPDIATLSVEAQAEIAADVIAMGLMLDSPFADKIHRTFLEKILPEHMKEFCVFAKKLLNYPPKGVA